MKRLVVESMKDPVVLEEAKRVIRSAGGKNRFSQAHAIASHMQSVMHFVRDPYQIETLHTPRYMIDRYIPHGIFEADCDDYAILSAALAKAVGLKTVFVIMGFLDQSAPWAHVFTMAETERGWVPFDVSFGIPPGVLSRRAYYDV
jgi:transglutaminase-like putative cysteine protease